MAVLRSGPTVRGTPVRTLSTAQLVSATGTQVTALALPTVAVLTLDAGPLAASLLFALEFGVQGLTAPLAGMAVDAARSRRRLLVLADLVHALVVSVVPAAYVLHQLSLGLLFTVAAVSGALTGVTSVGVQSLVAQVVHPDRLVAANASLTGARSVGQIVGPAVAGWLVQLVGAARAVAVDTVSYLLSAVLLGTLPPDAHHGTAPRPATSLRASVAVLRGRPVLIRIAAASAALNLGGAALGGLFALYAYRELRLSPSGLGLVFAVHSAAAILGVLTAPRVVRRLGAERVVPVFAPVAAAALLLIPAASVLPALPVLVVYETVFGYCATVWTIASVAVQQRSTPAEHLGRVLALSRTAGILAIPIGALLGGVLADAWGLLPTLVAFAVVALLGTGAVGASFRAGTGAAGAGGGAR